jgi:hypothetical protein
MSISFKELAEISNKNISQIVIDELMIENMNNITWLDLYNFLYHKANDIENIGKFDWTTKVTIIEENEKEE